MHNLCTLTLILLTWRIWWAPNNATKWLMGFNSAFKGLKTLKSHIKHLTFAPTCFGPLLRPSSGARKQHFARLLKWDLLIISRSHLSNLGKCNYSFNIPNNTHSICTLKSTKIDIKTHNTCPYMFRSLIKTILRGLVDSTLSSY